jgi:hypothetical protein
MTFISYWIPLTNTINFTEEINNFLDNNERFNNIADGVKINDNPLTLIIDENKNLNVKYEDKEYTLTYESHSDFGILTYSYPKDINEDFLDLLDVQIYHCLKDFFHVHECHHKEQDALLHAYKFTDKNEKDNLDKIIAHYSNTYESKILEYEENLTKVSPEIILEQYKSKKYKIKQAINVIAKAQRKILKIKAEFSYYTFLISFITDKDIATYHKRFYSNNINKLEKLYKEYEILDNQLDTEYTSIINKYQIGLAILGIVIGTFLGGVSWYYGYYGTTSKDLNNKYENLKQLHKDSSNSIHMINDNLKKYDKNIKIYSNALKVIII